MRAAASFLLLFLVIAALILPAVSRAQDAIPAGPSLAIPNSKESIKPLADKAYKRCLTKPDYTLSAEENQEYCLCLSVQMYRHNISWEEREFLATGKGSMDPRKAMSEFYGQCIGVPGRAATYHKCTHTPDIFKYVKGEEELKAMCHCVNNQMTDYWDKEAPAFIKMRMASKRPLEGDILQSLMKGRDFPVRYAKQRSACVRKYGRRD